MSVSAVYIHPSWNSNNVAGGYGSFKQKITHPFKLSFKSLESLFIFIIVGILHRVGYIKHVKLET